MRPRDDNKELLIRQKAIEILAQVGFEGLSMHKLAKACGLSVNTIYIYFGNREDLLVKIFDRVNEELTTASLAGFDPEMSLETGIRTLWRNRYRYFTRYPEHLMLMEHFNNSTLREKVNRKFHAQFERTMQTFLSNATERNQLLAMPFATYWSVAFAPLFQLLKFHHRQRTPNGSPYQLSETQVMEACDIVLRALTP